MYLLNTFLGFLIAQIADILTRDKRTIESPVRFNFVFFIKDTWLKILLSLILSVLLSVALHFNWDDLNQLIGKSWMLNKAVFLIIGAFPEIVLQYVKRKYGFLQPKEVEGYERK